MDYSENRSKLGKVWGVFVFLTVLSQMPSFVETSISHYLSTGSFLILFVIALIGNKTLYLPKTILSFYLIFSVFIAIASIVDTGYFQSAHTYTLYLSLFVIITGMLISPQMTNDDFTSIYNGYIVGAFFVSVDLFFQFFRSVSFDSYVYIYGSKNSVSQILLTAAVLVLFTKLTKKNGVFTILYVGLEILIAYLLLSLKSRATLIAIPIIIVLFLFTKEINRKIKWIVCILSIALLVALFCDPKIYDTVVNQVFLNGRQGQSLDVISSGRISMFDRFFERIQGNWIFGIGNSYVESFPLSVILNYGIFIGGLLILFSIYPMLLPLRILKSGNYSEHTSAFFLIALSYWLNSLFEQLAPFGPGCKCFFLWLLVGLLIGGNKVFYKKVDY